MPRTTPLVLGVLVVVGAGCAPASTDRAFETVTELYEAAGGNEWCNGELNVTLAPHVGNCGDPTGDSRIVLGVAPGGAAEIRASVDTARTKLVEDDQFLLVPTSADNATSWQLRSRDLELLAEAQELLGGVILDSEQDIDDWLD